MIIVSLHGITKDYPTGDVLRGINWEIKSGRKIALLGRNGSGKSTLLGVISGRIHPTAGTRTVGRNARIVEMSQVPEETGGVTLFDYLAAARGDLATLRARVEELTLAVTQSPSDRELQEQLGVAQTDLDNAGGYELEYQVERILTGLGFDRSQWPQPLETFSGGERTRVELGRLLLTPADLWLLDEPTNHLDIPAVKWLEDFLATSPVACVLVSHDRVLLERFAGNAAELTDGHLETYNGDYQYYRRERDRRRQRRQKAYDLQQAEIRRIEEFIARNIAGQKTRQAQSRRRALGKLQRLQAPTVDGHSIKLGFETQHMPYRDVLTVRNVRRTFGDRTVLADVSFVCERGDKIGIIGPNGAGKSTLIRAIVGHDPHYSGEIRIGERVVLGYFDQHLDILSGHGTVIEEIWDEYPHFDAGELRSYLARFLFRGDDVFKRVSVLSGGEKSRLALAKLMLTKANVLVLDEPTNHLDIAAREVLEKALAAFEGTALVVSHDRRFLDCFTTKILYVAEGTAALSLGNYSDWETRNSAPDEKNSASPQDRKKTRSDAATEWKARKSQRTESRRIHRRRRQLEDTITAIEHRVESIETQLADESIAHEWQRLAELADERSRLYDELAALYEDLENLPEPPPD